MKQKYSLHVIVAIAAFFIGIMIVFQYVPAHAGITSTKNQKQISIQKTQKIKKRRSIGKRPQTQNKIGIPAPTQQSQGGGCVNNPQPTFTHEFTDFSKIAFVAPVGGINVGTQSRSYIQIKKDASDSWPMVPLYAPAKATLKAIYYANRTYPSGVRGEYRLEFQASCEVTFVFDHIANVSDKIKALAPESPANDSHTGVYVSLPVEAGEQLGNTNGTGVAGTWDFYVFNTTKPQYHMNPSRWQSEHNKYAGCPYDYFTLDLKTQYYNALATWEGTKIDPPNCGQASHDVAGTLAGGWFLGDSTDAKGSELLVGSNFNLVEVLYTRPDPTQTHPDQARFGFRAHSFSVRPEAIKPGDSVCYSDNGSYAYFSLTSETQLLSASGSGNCPVSLLDTYETWNR